MFVRSFVHDGKIPKIMWKFCQRPIVAGCSKVFIREKKEISVHFLPKITKIMQRCFFIFQDRRRLRPLWVPGRWLRTILGFVRSVAEESKLDIVCFDDFLDKVKRMMTIESNSLVSFLHAINRGDFVRPETHFRTYRSDDQSDKSSYSEKHDKEASRENENPNESEDTETSYDERNVLQVHPIPFQQRHTCFVSTILR